MLKLRKILLLLSFSIAILYVVVSGLSEYKLRSVTAVTDFEYTLLTDETTLQLGEHVMRTRGCFGCHGQQLQGRAFTDHWPWVESAVAPNLIRYAQTHGIVNFEKAVRHGIGIDGKAFWSMPAYKFMHLSDRDLGAVFSYLKSAQVTDVRLPMPDFGLAARWEIAINGLEHMNQLVTMIPPLKIDPAQQPALARGEYLAMTTCIECHGFDLRGAKVVEGSTPDLAMVATYPEADFRRLMKEGIGLGGRKDLGLMSMVAKDRFANFTEQELIDLYRFLGSLAKPQESQSDK